MSLFAVTLVVFASSLVAGQTLDYQELFKQTFTQGASAIQNYKSYGFQFTVGKQEKAAFDNVFISLRVTNATKIPHTYKVLQQGAPKEYTYYQQKFTIVARASADFVGTLANGQEVKSYVAVPDAEIRIILSVDYSEFAGGFSATENEFDVSNVVTVLYQGAPEKVLAGSTVKVLGLPEGVSDDLKIYATNNFTNKIHEVIRTAIDYTVKALNHQ